jgi:hypothetical protein
MYKKLLLGLLVVGGTAVVAEKNDIQNPFELLREHMEASEDFEPEEMQSITDGFKACQNPRPDGLFVSGNTSECWLAADFLKWYLESTDDDAQVVELGSKILSMIDPFASTVTTPERYLTEDEKRVRDHLSGMTTLERMHQDPFKETVSVLTAHREEMLKNPSLKMQKIAGNNKKSVDDFLTETIRELQACKSNRLQCLCGVGGTEKYQEYTNNEQLKHLLKEVKDSAEYASL